MKKLIVSITIALSLLISITGTSNIQIVEAKSSIKSESKCVQLQSNKLKSNQTELFYMYSNEDGHYLLDPKAEFENVIYVGHDDFLITEEQAHHGNKFIGTFADDSLWELVGLEESK